MTPTLGGMVNSFLLVRFLGQSREREGEGERGPYLTALLLSQKNGTCSEMENGNF